VTIASVDPRHGRAVEAVARPTTIPELDAVCAGAAAVPRRVDGNLVLPALRPGTPPAAS
jgi:hypothetical protein